MAEADNASALAAEAQRKCRAHRVLMLTDLVAKTAPSSAQSLLSKREQDIAAAGMMTLLVLLPFLSHSSL